jgi:hypothetical protein
MGVSIGGWGVLKGVKELLLVSMAILWDVVGSGG